MYAGTLTDYRKNTDLCINGNGYFLVQYGDEVLYTRSGAFDFDVLGQLCAGGNGALVMGWLADPNNNWAIDTNAALTAIDIGRLSVLEPKASDWMEFAGNLDAETPISDSSAPGYPQYPIVTSKEVTDSRGNTHTVYFRFFKTGATAGSTTWRYQISYNDMDFVDDEDVNADTCTLEFDSSGKLVNINGASPASTDPINLPIPLSNGAADISLEIDFSAITEHRGKSDVWAEYVTGYPAGELSSISIGSDGVITGIFSNEERRDLAGLRWQPSEPGRSDQCGESLYRVSSNSGDAHVGIPGEGMRVR